MKTILIAAVALALACAAAPAGATSAPQDGRSPRSQYNLSEDGLALDGYDPVAYFPEGGAKPREGDAARTVEREGVTYRFATDANKAAFERNPERYEPAYGGWCAWAMADGKGDKVDVDPESYLIEEGRLLVFYDSFFADTRKKWSKKGGATLHPRADRNWQRISGEAPPRELGRWNLTKDGVALGGWDPVSLVAGAPREGATTRARTYRGVTYRFASDESLAAFEQDPARYEPQYGGWCAYAVAQGGTAPVVPEAALVQDGKLLMFKTPAIRGMWQERAAELTKAAEKTWEEWRAES